jgi:hypothetical protein
MTTITRKNALTLSLGMAVVALIAGAATATGPKALLLAPEHDCYLPTFGFSSFNIHGVGERITHVRWGGLASRLGLEPGDMILSMNGFALSYHGAWNDALQHAMASGGLVRLRIRDVRTGHVAYRQTFLGGSGPIVGPITPKYHVGNPVVHHHGPVGHHKHHVGYPAGPVTAKSKVGGGVHIHGSSDTLKKIAKLFD